MYKQVPDLWKKDSGKCVQRILKEELSQPPSLPREVMELYWAAVFTQRPAPALVMPAPKKVYSNIWRPIEVEEINLHNCPSLKTAPGPDGLKVKDLKRLPRIMVSKILNIFMWCGRLPERLCAKRTTLIPKTTKPDSPEEWGPLTVKLVLVRLFHKILNERLEFILLDPRQRGFREGYGCAENVTLLDMILRYHHDRHRSVFIAELDMAKAYDSDLTTPSNKSSKPRAVTKGS